MLASIIKNVQKYWKDQTDVEEELTHAYTFLVDLLDEREETSEEKKEQLLEHTFKVALRLSGWRQNLYITKAGLLHILTMNHETRKPDSKVMDQIRKKVDVTTSDYLWRYIHMKTQLLKLENQFYNGNYAQEKLPVESSPGAFYIIIAHRLEELLRDQETPSGSTIKLAQATEAFLIPEIKKQEAFYLSDRLQEYCFKITNRTQYNKIYEQVQEMQAMNSYSYQDFSNKMRALFRLSDAELPPVLRSYKKYFRGFYTSPRALSSLYRFFANTDYADQPKKCVEEMGVALYSMNLIVRDPVTDDSENALAPASNPVSIFLQFYKDLQMFPHLKPRFTIHKFSRNFEFAKTSFLISDESDNFYFLILRTESEFRRYRYGKVSDPETSDGMVEEDDSKIRVRKKDGEFLMIQKGATVLDFAFAIHSEIGLNYYQAIVGDSKMPTYYELKNGDQIEIIQNSKSKSIQPDLNWLKYVKTPLAKYELVKYFKTHYRADNMTLIVHQQQGGIMEIDAGSTLLDYAFKKHDKRALNYISGTIDKEPASMERLLKANDKVDVVLADHPQATLDWFLYVNTQHAREILIEYFKTQGRSE